MAQGPDAWRDEPGARIGAPRYGFTPSLLDPDDEPWADRVDGAGLLAKVDGFLGRFVVLDDEEARWAVSLFVLYCFSFDAFDTSPILAVLSPLKRCGKTALLAALSVLTPRPLMASNLTAPSLFRTVDACRPTLLIDEADSFLRGSEDLRGIVNSGHNRCGARVIRTIGEGHDPKVFSTWCAKVIAAIGSLPSTVEDRSIVVPMQRKRPRDRVERLRPAAREEARVLRRQARRWAEDHFSELQAMDVAEVPGLNDRAQDNWGPLLAVAEICGEGWAGRARRAAEVLSAAQEDEDRAVALLADLREVFAQAGAEQLPTATILRALNGMEERAWGAGRGVGAEALARLLRPFGVRPRSLSGRLRGYRLPEGLMDAFERYLPPPEQS